MKQKNQILLRLEQKNKIEKSQIKEILDNYKSQTISFADFLIQNNICSEIDYYSVLADMFSLPFSEFNVLELDKTLLQNFDFALLQRYNVVPIRKTQNGILIMATGNVVNTISHSFVGITTDNIQFILVPPSQIKEFLASMLASQTTANALSDLESEKFKQEGAEDLEIEETINAPAVRLVDSFIKEAVPFRASDIHIEPYEDEVVVRYRIDGDLTERMKFPIESYPAVCARLKIISGMNIAERRIPQDGRINLNINGAEYDFRVSTLPTVHGEKFVIRVLDKTSFNFSREDLGFTPEENKIIDKILAHPHGLVLLTGPTGCGKSTTLYSFLKEVNKPDVNIVTVEDPVEYTMQGINQTQVNVKANMTFATALRSILRQDPDIIMIGEIRDEETAQIGIRAAITGHLVFSTLHTNDAPGAVTRLVDMGVNSCCWCNFSKAC